VTLEAPAPAVLTDFQQSPAATVSRQASLSEAEQEMMRCGVRRLIVVGESAGVLGVIGARDLYGEQTLCLQQEHRVSRRDLKVADVMTGLGELDALSLHSLSSASVGDVVETLRHTGRRHLLVIEVVEPAGAARVRGVISLAQIERQLGMHIEPVGIAWTFAEIARTLA
jgi:CBS domain-containing protein